ncbi:MAG TPA: hypothetical protein VFK03_02265, partial [Candidatus Saccharimonadales bacterium]|nr:hypothetical protein [Candidatus Saccharimonadales bacterium]
TVNLATGGALQTITIGSTNSTSSVKIQGGTGNSVNIESQGTISIGNNGVAQNITIGNGTGATSVAVQCGTGSCGLGTNATDHATSVGSTTGGSQTSVQGGTNGVAIQASATGAIVIGNTNNNNITLGGSSSTITVAGNLDISGILSTKKGTDVSIITLTDFNFGNVSLIRLTGASGQTINSLVNGSGTANRDGEQLTIVNASGFNATITNETGTTPAFRIRTGTGGTVSLSNDSSISLIYDSGVSRWRVIGDVAGGAGGGVTTVGAYSSATTCANGAQIATNTITLCSASGNNPGLVDNSNQSFNGNKTFTGTTTLAPTGNNVGSAVIKQTSGTATSGDILDVQGANGTTHFLQVTQTAANAATVLLQSVGGSNGLTIQSGSGTVSLGTSTTLNASGALTVASGGSSDLTLNSASNT